MEDKKMTNKRPGIITAICVLGFIGPLFLIPIIFSDIATTIGSWYPPYLAFSGVVGFVCMVGLWMMKKWGTITYTALVGINQVVLIAMGEWNIFFLIIPGIVIAIVFSKFKEME
jgi:glycerol-3-phosphate acyltransferase PlsY